MLEQESTSLDVELTGLIGGNDDGRVDGNDISAKSPGGIAGKAAKPLGRRFSGSSCLCFVAAIVSMMLVVLSGWVGNFSSENSAAVADDVGGDGTSFVEPPWLQMRWRPISTGDNCLPGLRLANSTIHCGVGNLSPVSVSSDGVEYCGGVKMEPNGCVLPTEGRWALPPSPSTMDKNVIPLPRRFGINDTRALPRCKTMEDLQNGTYRGSGYDQEWVPETCSVVPLSPFAWTRNAACRTTIAMIGDSHVRNMFHATVNGLRGMESFAEAHADGEGKAVGRALTYEWRLNGDGSATDRFGVHTATKINEPTFFEDCPCENVKRCLRIFFIWAPTFDEQLSEIDVVKKWDSNLVIVEPGNSYESSVVLSSRWTEEFDELLQEDKNLKGVGVLHFSWGDQPIALRKNALNEWTTSGTYPDRKSYLPQSAMNPNYGMQGQKTFHFACGLGKVNVRNDNIVAAEPCTDVVDTTQVRALVTIHFDALANP